MSYYDPYGQFEVNAYQQRGRGYGWETRYEFTFNPNLNPGLLTRIGRGAGKLLGRVDTKPVGPKRPVLDVVECEALDLKLKKSYDIWFADKDGGRLTEQEAMEWLDAMRERYPEMDRLYGSNQNMLSQAEVNSKDHWQYKMNPD